MSIKLKNCDYIDLINEMLDEKIKVDLLLTDPPYCVSRSHQLGFSNMGRAGMDYGEWDYNFDQKEWIIKTSKLVKDGGSIVIFNDWKNISYMCEALQESGYIIKDLLRPMRDTLRSLNLSNSVAIAVYEILRQDHFEGLRQDGALTRFDWSDAD